MSSLLSYLAYSSNVRFTPNSKFIFTSTLDSAIRLWDYQTDKMLKSYSNHVNRK